MGVFRAYLTLRDAQPRATAAVRYELGVYGHGRHGTELVCRLREQIKVWDRDWRHHPGAEVVAALVSARRSGPPWRVSPAADLRRPARRRGAAVDRTRTAPHRQAVTAFAATRIRDSDEAAEQAPVDAYLRLEVALDLS